MKTKNLFTSLAAAVMLSTSLAGSGVLMNQTVHADTVSAASSVANATTQTTKKSSTGSISIKPRTVTVTVNSDKPKVYTVGDDGKSLTSVDSSYTKGQTIQVYFSVPATSGSGNNTTTMYYIVTEGKKTLIPSDEVTASASVPDYDAYEKQMKADVKAIQDAYNNRELKSITVSAKSKKGAKIYHAYRKSKKSKKVYFKASKKKIKYGKKYKSSMIVKNGKTKYVYIGKKRYVKSSAVKIVSAKYAAVNLPADLKSLVTEN